MLYGVIVSYAVLPHCRFWFSKCLGCQGSFALYPNNDPTQVAKKGPGGGMLFVICVFVLAYGCSWGPGGWVNSKLNYYNRCCSRALILYAAGEIAPLRTRAKQLSFVSGSNVSDTLSIKEKIAKFAVLFNIIVGMEFPAVLFLSTHLC